MAIEVLDLFAGAGGITAGFHAIDADFRTVAAVEMDADAAASFEATFGTGIVAPRSIQAWLKDGSAPSSVDIVVGGPPCQGFSLLGKRALDDERNSLWEHYAETIALTSPKLFVMENVAAFSKTVEFEKLVEETQTGKLQEYELELAILNAADYGAPQARRRAVVIGHRKDFEYTGFPEPTHSARGEAGLRPHITVRDALAGVPAIPDMDSQLGSRSVEHEGTTRKGPFSPRQMHWSRAYRKISLDRFAAIPEGGNRFDLPDELKAPCWINHTSGSGDVMGRLHWDRPSVTIRTEFFKPEKGRYIHPTENRAITHYEAALLQGFPESHRFVGSRTSIARQIGNAVPIQLAAAIGRHLKRSLDENAGARPADLAAA